MSAHDERDPERPEAGGSPPRGRDAELGDVLRELTARTAKRPPEQVEAAHLIAMAELARGIAEPPHELRPVDAGASPRRETAPPQGRFALGALTPILALVGIVGIAFAGASLPDAIRAPFDAAGITLPNQLQPAGLERVGAEALRNGGPGTLLVHAARGPAKKRGGTERNGDREPRRSAPSQASAAPGTASPGAEGGPGQAIAHAQATAAPVASPPPSAGGGQGVPSGGGQPAPSAPTKVAPPPASPLPSRPGKGCGDTNHVHTRASECK